MRVVAMLATVPMVWISACVSAYRAPADGPQATVIAKATRLYFYSNERCDNATKVQAPIFGDQTAPSVAVAADRAVFVGGVFDTRGAAYGAGVGVESLCIATGSFMPVPDATYEVAFHLDASHRTCSLNVQRVADDGGRTGESSYRPFVGTTKCIDNLF